MTDLQHDVDDITHCRTCTRCRETRNKRVRARVQSRALKLLARTFPIEYNALYLQELAEEQIVEGPRSRQETRRA